MNSFHSSIEQAEIDVSLYQPEDASRLIMAQKTLSIRKKLEAFGFYSTLLLLIWAIIFVSGIGGQLASLLSFLACLCSGVAAWAFDVVQRKINRLT